MKTWTAVYIVSGLTLYFLFDNIYLMYNKLFLILASKQYDDDLCRFLILLKKY